MKPKITKQLVYVPSKPEKGFNFGYFLNIRNIADGKLNFVVECNNVGVLDDVQVTKTKTQKRIEEAQDIAIRLQNQLTSSVALIPAFIRPNIEGGNIYTHSLTSMALNTQREDIKRVDRQLIKMIEDAREYLKNEGFELEEKLILTGFSASAKFAQRFAFLYPELVSMVIAGGMGATLCLPIKEYDGVELNYPLGTNDYSKYQNKPFNEKAFNQIKQYFFIGADDKNDPVPYGDCYTHEEREAVYKIFGKDMQNERWPKMLQILNELGLNNITCIKMDGVEHSSMGMMEWLYENVFKTIKNKSEIQKE